MNHLPKSNQPPWPKRHHPQRPTVQPTIITSHLLLNRKTYLQRTRNYRQQNPNYQDLTWIIICHQQSLKYPVMLLLYPAWSKMKTRHCFKSHVSVIHQTADSWSWSSWNLLPPDFLWLRPEWFRPLSCPVVVWMMSSSYDCSPYNLLPMLKNVLEAMFIVKTHSLSSATKDVCDSPSSPVCPPPATPTGPPPLTPTCPPLTPYSPLTPTCPPLTPLASMLEGEDSNLPFIKLSQQDNAHFYSYDNHLPGLDSSSSNTSR